MPHRATMHAPSFEIVRSLLLPAVLCSTGASALHASEEVPTTTVADLGTSIVHAVSAYDPTYIVAGISATSKARFQFGLKFHLLDGPESVPGDIAFFDNVYFSYAQTTLWDLSAKSIPVDDTSYRPAFFYLHDRLVERGDWGLGLRTGFEHESNGKSGDDSRGITSLFLEPRLHFGTTGDWHVEVRPKAYVYVRKTANPDIADYRGYADLQLSVESTNGLLVSLVGRKGTESGKGSAEFDASYPLAKLIPMKNSFYLMAQYFYGYGETLIGYNERESGQVRIGFMLIR